jgi:hypothetical protein
MQETDRDLVEKLQREERGRLRIQPALLVERPTIHYTELPGGTSDSQIAVEWNFYRREVGRLLAEGHEGRWVLIKGEEIIGIWDTEEEADRVRLERFLMQPVLLHQIRVREPVLRGGGHNRRWPS